MINLVNGRGVFENTKSLIGSGFGTLVLSILGIVFGAKSLKEKRGEETQR